MANSGHTAIAVSEQLTLTFTWAQAKDAVAGGSWVHWWMILNAGENGGIDAVPGSAWSVTIEDETFSGRTNITVAPGSMKELASGSAFLKHDENGERSFSYSFSQYLNIYTSAGYIGTVTGSGSGVLDYVDMDAAPILEPAEVELGGTVVITPQGPANATYKISYAVGGVSGIIAENITDPVEWLVPEALGAEFPYTSATIVRIICTSYVDGKRKGREREAALKVTVPKSAIPTVENLTWKDESAAADIGILIQNISRIRASAECAGAMGSLVMSCAFYVGEDPLTTSPLRESGEVTLTAVAVDSRGRTGSTSVFLDVNPWQPPCVRVTAHRCLENGTADDTGGFVEITVAAGISEFAGNTATVTLEAGTNSDEKTINASQELQWIYEAPTESTIGIAVTIRDLFGTGFGEMVLSTAYATIDLLYGGKGIAFGTTALQEGFWCAMNAHFTGDVSMGSKILLPDGTDLVERLAALEASVAALKGN